MRTMDSARGTGTVCDQIGIQDEMPKTLYAQVIKTILDRSIAVVLLVLMAPVLLIGLFLVKLTSRGPAVYKQERLGLRGKPFTLYKIRSMRLDSESVSGPTWSLPGDPRITFIGTFLRLSHVDELPQLINVIQGDLSLVGPRPERPSIAKDIESEIPCFRSRLFVKPGLTGLAQVQQASDDSLMSVRRKLEYDLAYIRSMGLGLDLRILISTPLYILGVPVSMLAMVFQLPGRNVKGLDSAYSQNAFPSISPQNIALASSSET